MKLKECNPKFKEFLQEREFKQILMGHNMESLLVLPIQRLPRYELIFKEIIKRTTEDHHDYDNLKDAFDKIKGIISTINKKMDRWSMI